MAATRFRRLVTAFDSRPVAKAARQFSRVSGHHVAAALVLKSAFHGLARLDVEKTGRHAVLVWSAISIGESPLTGSPER